MDREELYHRHEHYAKETLYKMYGNPKSMCMRYRISLEDLLQYAKEGLWKACLDWNPEKSKFTTFAINNIRWNVQTRLRTECNYTYNKATLKGARNVEFVSIDEQLINDDEGKVYHEIIPSNVNVYDDVHDKLVDEKIFSHLSDQHKEIIKLRGEGLSFRKIAKLKLVNRETIARQIRKLREPLKELFEQAM